MSFMGGNTFVYSMTFRGESAELVGTVDTVKSHVVSLGETAEQTSNKWSQAQTTMIRGWQRMLFGVQMGIFYFSMLISVSDSIRTTTLSLEEAQADYNKTLSEYGFYSEEAVSAGRRLEKAQIAVRRANELATLSYVGMGLQVVNLGLEIARNLPQIYAWISAQWASATASAAAAPWKAPLIIGAAAAVAGVAGGYMLSSTLNYSGGTSKSDLDDFERAQQARDRQERYDLRRATG